MANVVIKRNGSSEPFDKSKIKNSIVNACRDTGLSEDETSEVVEEVSLVLREVVSGRSEVSTSEIRNEILSELEEIKPEVATTWMEYDEEMGKI